MECLTAAKHYINPKTDFTFKRGFDYRSYPQSKNPDCLLDSYFATFYISVCHPEFQTSTDSLEELPPWARGSVPLLQWSWRPRILDFSCQHNLDPKLIVAIDIPQTPPHYPTGIDEFKEVDVYRISTKFLGKSHNFQLMEAITGKAPWSQSQRSMSPFQMG